MARFRLSLPARADLAQILAVSVERWEIAGKRRYAEVLAAGMRKVAADPDGPTTRDRTELCRGIRSFHLRNVRIGHVEAKVRKPVHVLFYRVVGPGVVEIVRILHERMDPSRHIGADPKSNEPLSKWPTK
jgi:toxin ParE1/3/4